MNKKERTYPQYHPNLYPTLPPSLGSKKGDSFVSFQLNPEKTLFSIQCHFFLSFTFILIIYSYSSF